MTFYVKKTKTCQHFLKISINEFWYIFFMLEKGTSLLGHLFVNNILTKALTVKFTKFV